MSAWKPSPSTSTHKTEGTQPPSVETEKSQSLSKLQGRKISPESKKTNTLTRQVAPKIRTTAQSLFGDSFTEEKSKTQSPVEEKKEKRQELGKSGRSFSQILDKTQKEPEASTQEQIPDYETFIQQLEAEKETSVLEKKQTESKSEQKSTEETKSPFQTAPKQAHRSSIEATVQPAVSFTREDEEKYGLKSKREIKVAQTVKKAYTAFVERRTARVSTEAKEAEEAKAATDLQTAIRGLLGRKEAEERRKQEATNISQIIKQLPRLERERIEKLPPFQQLAELQKKQYLSPNQMIRHLLHPDQKQLRESFLLIAGWHPLAKDDWLLFAEDKPAQNKLQALQSAYPERKREADDITNKRIETENKLTEIENKLRIQTQITSTKSDIEELTELVNKYGKDTYALRQLADKYQISYDKSQEKSAHLLRVEIRTKLREKRKELESALANLEKQATPVTNDEKMQVQAELNGLKQKEASAKAAVKEIEKTIAELQTKIKETEQTYPTLLQEMEKLFERAQTFEEKATILEFAQQLIEKGIFPRSAFEHGIFKQANLFDLKDKALMAEDFELPEQIDKFAQAKEPKQERITYEVIHKPVESATPSDPVTEQFKALAKGKLKGKAREQFIEDFAQTINIRFSNLFANVPHTEYYRQAWTKAGLEIPNLIELKDSFNEVSWGVTDQILAAENPKEAVRLYAAFVEIAIKQLEMEPKNFSGAQAIFSGLDKAPLARLRLQRFLPKETLEQYDKLNQLCDPTDSFKNLRTAMSDNDPIGKASDLEKRGLSLDQYKGKENVKDRPYIPSIVLLLVDLTFADDGNPDKTERGLNNNKADLLADMHGKVDRAQKKLKKQTKIPYDLDHAFLTKGKGDKEMQDRVYPSSYKLMPKGHHLERSKLKGIRAKPDAV